MKNMRKVIVIVIVVSTILTMSVFADGYLQKLDRDLSRCDSVEDHGYLVIEATDGSKYVIEFDNEAEFMGFYSFDEYGDIDDEPDFMSYRDADIGSADSIKGVYFYH